MKKIEIIKEKFNMIIDALEKEEAIGRDNLYVDIIKCKKEYQILVNFLLESGTMINSVLHD